MAFLGGRELRARQVHAVTPPLPDRILAAPQVALRGGQPPDAGGPYNPE